MNSDNIVLLFGNGWSKLKKCLLCTGLIDQCVIIIRQDIFLVSTIFNEGAYLTFKPIFHKALNLF